MTASPVPAPECDIVMKGGITSGVIYPMAVVELAKTYRLRSVGGASAGAIAAAAAAAAEFGRARGGFEELATLPHDLNEDVGGRPRLFRLFQPTKATYSLFRAFTAGMGRSAPTLRTILAVLTGFWPWALGGTLPGILVVVVCATGSGWPRCLGILAGLALALIGLLAGVVLGIVKVLNGMPKAGFGLCTGLAGKGGGGAEALTPWLHGKLQSIAGRAVDADPLTFGELTTKGIELKTMTTNLTRREPMVMPWNVKEYFFDPAAMHTLFPQDVVTWMESHPPANEDSDGKPLTGKELWDRNLLQLQALRHDPPLRPFPAADNVPILVATRMSLSFPLLITAVPLHAVDYNLVVNKKSSGAAEAWHEAHPDGTVEDAADALKDQQPRFDANWFSDGGICSNLPVHFFDSSLPTRPTFAVDLASFPDGQLKNDDDQSKNVYLPLKNADGRLRRWVMIPTSGITGLTSFLSGIVDTARGWVDAAQLGLPGYRDRVVTIFHDDDEGGMNLAMPAQRVKDLSARGEAAAEQLVTKFAGQLPGKPKGWGWDNHRWIRFRTATAGLDVWLGRFGVGYRTDSPGAKPYRELAGPDADAPLPSYKLDRGARSAVNDRTGELLGLVATWGDDAMLTRAPKPRPRMRLVPDDGGSAAGLAQTGATDAPGGAAPDEEITSD